MSIDNHKRKENYKKNVQLTRIAKIIKSCLGRNGRNKFIRKRYPRKRKTYPIEYPAKYNSFWFFMDLQKNLHEVQECGRNKKCRQMKQAAPQQNVFGIFRCYKH